VELIREAILTGVYRPGQRLSEPEVARRFDVSITPVREALNSLAATGLVERNGRQGTHVRRLGMGDVRNLFAVRETLECLAVRQATEHLTPADHQRLNSILDRQAEANELMASSRSLATKRLSELNDDFHGLILRRSANEWVEALLASIGDLLIFARVRLRETVPWERRIQSLEEHRQIAEALCNRDGESAARTMSEHLRHLERHIVNQMSEDEECLAADPLAGREEGVT